MTDLSHLSIFQHLHTERTPLLRAASFGNGIAAALWNRDIVITTEYEAPNHHTLSLYVEDGAHIRKRIGSSWRQSQGPGDLCVMPSAASSHWTVDGHVKFLHLYFTEDLFNRTALETFDRDPAALTLREDAYFRNPILENLLRTSLQIGWNDTSDRIATSHLAQATLTWLLGHMTDRSQNVLTHQGGLAPHTLTRVKDYIEASLADPISITDLAAIAHLSPHHFARAFRKSAGEPPYSYVLKRRISHAETLLRAGHSPSETALLCGFSSHSHFSAQFAKTAGISPGRFATLAARRP